MNKKAFRVALLFAGFLLAWHLSAWAQTPLSPEPSASLPALKVQGSILVAGDKPIRLRGIDWGWWHLSTTRYSEADMQHVAGWGANVVRLVFSYSDLETDGDPAAWKEEGFRQLDEVVQWARRYGVYVILDMHVVPGGQDDAAYCAGGHNLIWTDASAQRRFTALWSELARRYRDRPEVAAYELMNEPGSKQKTPELLCQIDGQAIRAIRAIDPAKMIVVGGDGWSNPENLTDPMKFADDNILYTFHWYKETDDGVGTWMKTARAKQGVTSTQDWVKLDETFVVPTGAHRLQVMLRSDNNAGLAWFDDVEVKDAAGKVLSSDPFIGGPGDYRAERAGFGTMTFDPSTGHEDAGSLMVRGTSGYDGWAGKALEVQAGEACHISGWVKLAGATGETYLAAAFFTTKHEVDSALFKKQMGHAIAFAKKYQVPVWVGEFGCGASNPDYQISWVKTSISIFEEEGFNWTYWNDKETTGPATMALQAEHHDGSDYPVNGRLLAALRAGWALNATPAK
jgi:endoglucanase